jgi:hypothetical protein
MMTLDDLKALKEWAEQRQCTTSSSEIDHDLAEAAGYILELVNSLQKMACLIDDQANRLGALKGKLAELVNTYYKAIFSPCEHRVGKHCSSCEAALDAQVICDIEEIVDAF